jgi:Xaa-Pro dipeptidase
MSTEIAERYPAHHGALVRRYETALDAHGLDGVVVFAGRPRFVFQDDQTYPFQVGPWYRQWVPEPDHAGSFIVFAPGRRPRLVCYQPRDYWHVVPSPPAGFWTDAFEIETADTPDAALALLPGSLSRWALLGDADEALAAAGFGSVNPPDLVRRLQFDRLYKTDYELACLREANRRAARGHLAARDAFLAGHSEFRIHLAYLEAVGQGDDRLPYASIVALNEHAATLHYDASDARVPDAFRSFLLDAGADCRGYAADITRTWAAPSQPGFHELIDLLDEAQQSLVEGIHPGMSYVDLHRQMHRQIAGILAATGLVDMPPDAMTEAGVTRVFFPHGLGHHLGLQVHDVAGKIAGPAGPEIDQPPEDPFLRNLRPVEPGNVFTVEPGIYFIPQLLEPLRARPEATAVNWGAVEALIPCGGVRIEDDVAVNGTGTENLTRAAFAELGG